MATGGDDNSGSPPAVKKRKKICQELDETSRRIKGIMESIMQRDLPRLERLLALRGSRMDDPNTRGRPAPYLMATLLVDMSEPERCHCIRLLVRAGHSLQGCFAINMINSTTIFDCFSYACMKCMHHVVRCMLELGAIPNPEKKESMTVRATGFLYGGSNNNQPPYEITLRGSTASSLTMALCFYNPKENAQKMRCIILDLLRAGSNVDTRERVFTDEVTSPLEICVGKQVRDPFLAEILVRLGAAPYDIVLSLIADSEKDDALPMEINERFKFLHSLLKKPLSLSELSRIKIRSCLGQGWSVTRKIHHLEVPASLKDYLDLDDIVQHLRKHNAPIYAPAT